MTYIRKITRAGQLTEEYKKYVEQQKRKIKKVEALKKDAEDKKHAELMEEMKEEAKQKRVQDRKNQKIRQQLGLKYNMSSTSQDIDDELKRLIDESPDKVLQAYESGNDELLLKKLMKMRMERMDPDTRALYNADKEHNDAVTMLNHQVKLYELFDKIGSEVTKVSRAIESRKEPTAPAQSHAQAPEAAPEAAASQAAPSQLTEEERKERKKAKKQRQKEQQQQSFLALIEKEKEEKEMAEKEMAEKERADREKQEEERRKTILSAMYNTIPEDLGEIDEIYKVDPLKENAKDALVTYLGENYNRRTEIASFLDRGDHDHLIEMILNFDGDDLGKIRRKSKRNNVQLSWLVPKSVLSGYERRNGKKVAKGRTQGHYVTSELLTGGKQAMRNRIFDKIDNLYAAGLINKTQHKQMASQLI